MCKLFRSLFGHSNKKTPQQVRYPAALYEYGSEESDFSAIEKYINLKRQRHGLAPLMVEYGLQKEALLRLEEIKRNLRHKPESDKHSAILKAKGLLLYSENIGYAGSADQLAKSWYSSPDHRPQILNEHFRYTGIAGELVGHLYFGVQIFGR